MIKGEENERTSEASENEASPAQEKEPEKGWHQVELTPYSPLLARLKTLRQAVRQVQDATRAQIQKQEAIQKEAQGQAQDDQSVGESS